MDGPTLNPVEVPIFGLILPTQTANTQYTTEVIPSSSAPSETDDTCPIRQILWENNWGRNLYNTVYSIQYTCDTYGNECHNCVQYNLSPEQGRPSRGPKRVYHTHTPLPRERLSIRVHSTKRIYWYLERHRIGNTRNQTRALTRRFSGCDTTEVQWI